MTQLALGRTSKATIVSISSLAAVAIQRRRRRWQHRGFPLHRAHGRGACQGRGHTERCAPGRHQPSAGAWRQRSRSQAKRRSVRFRSNSTYPAFNCLNVHRFNKGPHLSASKLSNSRRIVPHTSLKMQGTGLRCGNKHIGVKIERSRSLRI